MFSNKTYAKIWKLEEKKGMKIARISTSCKNQQGEYEQDFSGFVQFVGKAKEFSLSEGDTVQMVSVGVTTKYDKEKNTTYTNYICFELANAKSNNSSNEASSPAMDEGNLLDGLEESMAEELPFD